MPRQVLTVRESALKFLARREHSRGELRRKLSERFGFGERDAIESELSRLSESGLQSDSRFAEMFVRESRTKFAPRRIRSELKRRGVSDAEIDSALAESQKRDGKSETGGESELELARRLLSGKRRRAAESPEAAKRESARLMRWLMSRGVSVDAARRALGAEED